MRGDERGYSPLSLSALLPASTFCDCIISIFCLRRVETPRRGQELGSTSIDVSSGAALLKELTLARAPLQLCLQYVEVT